MLDGVSSPDDMGSGCIHDVRWYVHQLGTALLQQLETPATLRECLAIAIKAVAASHAATCDLAHPGTPSATVAIVRERERTWDHLVLSDTTIVLDCHSGLHVVTDNSVETVATAESHASRTSQAGTAEHDQRLRDLIAAQRRLR
ncbi:MAG: hypothetical protein ACRDLN_09165, partial [Solirubrobacteraceae bacterium]